MFANHIRIHATLLAITMVTPSACGAADPTEQDPPNVANNHAPLWDGPCESNEVCRAARDAYVYGYPLMLMKYTKRALLSAPGGRINHFLHKIRRPSPSDQAVVRPNEDTLYSIAFLDLSDGPQILDVPAVAADPTLPSRFYLLQLLDGWTTSMAGSPGTANTGTDAQSFAIVGPNHSGTVEGVDATYRMATNMVWILGRTRIKDGLQDHLDVLRIQRGYCLRSLTDFQNNDRSSCESNITIADAGKGLLGLLSLSSDSPPEIVETMGMGRFLMELATLMADNPAYDTDGELLTRLEDVLGFVPGKPYLPSLSTLSAMQPARVAALARMRGYAYSELGPVEAGWTLALNDIGTYGTNFLRRAAVSLVGFGANLPEDGIYPTASRDVDGRALTSNQRYALHFAAGELPPVNTKVDGFWSVSLYNEQGYFIENDQQRYAVHSWQLDQQAQDSVTIYIGCATPPSVDAPSGADPGFWLPAPVGDERLQVTLRMYAPDARALPPVNDDDELGWKPPGVELLGDCD